MAIQFGGLATGLDTNAIIEQLLNIERLPIVRMETDKSWMNNRLSALTELDSKLKGMQSVAAGLKNGDGLKSKKTSLTSHDFFKATTSLDALEGTNYDIEVVSLAEVQKSVSTGFSSKTAKDFGTGDLSFSVGGDAKTVAIDSSNNSLEGIMQAINDAEIGVKASIINDGDPSNPYRLMLTGDNVATAFTMNDGLVGGTDSLGDFDDEATDPNPPVQLATQAHIRVDTIDIYSNSNTVTDAIPGVDLDLTQAETGTTTQLSISLDTGDISTKLEAFVSGYNDVVSFIMSQSTYGDTQAGILAGDSGVNTIKRHMQDMLTTTVGSGTYTALANLGLETQKDGTVSVNSTTLSEAIDKDVDSVIALLSGDETTDGIMDQFIDYLAPLTSSSSGMLVGRKTSIESNINRLDDRIAVTETRLTKREETVRAQFTAMEQLVSSMQAQSNFLTQQLTNISNLSNNK